MKWVQSGFLAFLLHKIDPETPLGPTFGPLPATDKNPIFDPPLCQMNCLTILVLTGSDAMQGKWRLHKDSFRMAIRVAWKKSDIARCRESGLPSVFLGPQGGSVYLYRYICIHTHTQGIA